MVTAGLPSRSDLRYVSVRFTRVDVNHEIPVATSSERAREKPRRQTRWPRLTGKQLLQVGTILVFLYLITGRASAHGGGLGAAKQNTLQVPFWLFLSTGGGVIAASFLLASFATDRKLIRWLHNRRWRKMLPPWTTGVRFLGWFAGLLGLGFVLAAGVIGPISPLQNFAILGVWVGWWAGLVMVAYLVGNVWPLVNPWRVLVTAIPMGPVYRYPKQIGAWPSVVALLGLISLEALSPIAESPTLLVQVVTAYTVTTITGAVLFGQGIWFRNVDPIAKLFRYYGRLAPISIENGELRVTYPGARLTEAPLVDGLGEVAFVIAILWVTTFDGFLSTPTVVSGVKALVGLGVPPLLVYLTTLVVGFAVFFGAYLLGVGYMREFGQTTLPGPELARRFAPSLLPIAAGYHLAHFLGYFLRLSPALVQSMATPLSGQVSTQMLVLPGWFGAVEIGFVLLGHLLGIWVAHATSFEVFPSRIRAIKSQYPLIGVMVLYTMTGLWIVSRPSLTLPYL